MVTAIGGVGYGMAARQSVLSLLDHTDFRVIVGCDEHTAPLIPASPRVTTVPLCPRGDHRAAPFLAKFDLWRRALDEPDARLLLHLDADAVLTRHTGAADLDHALGSRQLGMVEQTSITGSTMDRVSFLGHFREHSLAYLAPEWQAPPVANFRFHNSGLVVFRSLELRNFLGWADAVAASTDGSHTVGEHMIADQDYLQVWTNVLRRGHCADLDWSWNHCRWWDEDFPRSGDRVRHFSNFCNGPPFSTAVAMERARTGGSRTDADTGPRLTAVVVTHESSATIGDCLGALMNIPDIRVVVVDNDSSDGTVSQTDGADTVLLNDRNIGFGAAVGRALESVTTDVMCLVNPDCFVTDEAISESLRVFESAPRSVVVPRYVHADGSVVHGRRPGYTRRRLRSDILDSAGRLQAASRLRDDAADDPGWHWPLAALMTVRVDVFREIGGFDPAYFCYMEDVEFGRACTAAGVGIVEIDAPVVHLGASGSAVSDHDRVRLLDRARLTYARRHHGTVFAQFLRALAGVLALRRFIGRDTRGGHR